MGLLPLPRNSLSSRQIFFKLPGGLSLWKLWNSDQTVLLLPSAGHFLVGHACRGRLKSVNFGTTKYLVRFFIRELFRYGRWHVKYFFRFKLYRLRTFSTRYLRCDSGIWIQFRSMPLWTLWFRNFTYCLKILLSWHHVWLSRTIFRRTRQIGIDRLTEFFFVLIFFLFPWYSSGEFWSQGQAFLSCLRAKTKFSSRVVENFVTAIS